MKTKKQSVIHQKLFTPKNAIWLYMSLLVISLAFLTSCSPNETTENEKAPKSIREYLTGANDPLEQLRNAAEEGDANSQFHLALKYYHGKDVAKDYAMAEKWMRKAAEQGHKEAQFNLALIFYNGDGVPINYPEAEKWYRKAAEQGLVDAQYNLAWMHYNGKGVPVNHEEAAKWYRKAAEQGHKVAQNNLGVCYVSGQGVVQDYAEAVKWYLKAAEQGEALSQNNLGELYEFGKGVAQNYGEATKWYLKAAEQGYASAQFNLGRCHEEGHGVSKDYGEAVKWYRKSAAQGNTKAQKKLGAMYGNEATSGATKDAASAEAEIMKILLSINRNNIFKAPNFNEKKLNNAIMSYAPGVERTDILLHSDDTVFGGAKEGCIITKDTLYFKGLLSEPGKVRIEKGFIFTANGGDIMLGNMKLLHLSIIEDWELRQIVSILNILAASAGNN